MKTYIVRVWVDLKIASESREEAKQIAHNVPIKVAEVDNKLEVYDTQVGDIWEREE